MIAELMAKHRISQDHEIYQEAAHALIPWADLAIECHSSCLLGEIWVICQLIYILRSAADMC